MYVDDARRATDAGRPIRLPVPRSKPLLPQKSVPSTVLPIFRAESVRGSDEQKARAMLLRKAHQANSVLLTLCERAFEPRVQFLGCAVVRAGQCSYERL